MEQSQHVQHVENLPQGSLDAWTAFAERYLDQCRSLLSADATEAIAIVMSPAGPEHDDWRRAVARDLARESAPKRVNVVAGNDGPARDATLAYLANAPGVTGQYCKTHE